MLLLLLNFLLGKLEMQLAAAEDLYYFKKQVIHKMTEWPFYHTARNAEEQYVTFIINMYNLIKT